jgi:hypothetical protein
MLLVEVLQVEEVSSLSRTGTTHADRAKARGTAENIFRSLIWLGLCVD